MNEFNNDNYCTRSRAAEQRAVKSLLVRYYSSTVLTTVICKKANSELKLRNTIILIIRKYTLHIC